MRHFINPYPDYVNGSQVNIDSLKITRLIESYVRNILQNINWSGERGDLYVGTSGMSYMFLKLYQSQLIEQLNQPSLDNAKIFIEHAKQSLRNRSEDAASFLCGNAGIHAVTSIIHLYEGKYQDFHHERNEFMTGYPVCQKLIFNRHGCDEILFGRAGYLSAIYWINQFLPPDQRISSEVISNICDVIIESGIQYSQRNKLKVPMMWECYGDKYLGAAHGISAILHMLLESPLFNGGFIQQLNKKQMLVKATIDEFLLMQSADGNFPSVLEDSGKAEHKLVHWCHGAPGAVYLFAKAFIIFKDQKYLDCCLRCGELVWAKGLLRKGPGICHGVAGSGYVFLLLYRLTNDPKHLYRAAKFADFLTNEEFLREARQPDRPLSLYEGISGTVCFLVDLLQPHKASFPFMDVFDVKF
jgi:lantibiotic modifying enzyme